MPQIGPLEIMVVALVALIVFGPKRLPDMARQVGRAMAELRRQAGDLRSEFEGAMNVEDEQPAPVDDLDDDADKPAAEPSDGPAEVATTQELPAEAVAGAAEEPEMPHVHKGTTIPSEPTELGYRTGPVEPRVDPPAEPKSGD